MLVQSSFNKSSEEESRAQSENTSSHSYYHSHLSQWNLYDYIQTYTMTTLNFSQNKIDSIGAKYLADGLRQITVRSKSYPFSLIAFLLFDTDIHYARPI